MKPKDYRKMLSGLKRADRKPIQPYTNFNESNPAKIQLRALTVIRLLCEGPKTLQELADDLNVSTRTIRRYCAVIVDSGSALEADELGRYQLEQCPLCKKELALK